MFRILGFVWIICLTSIFIELTMLLLIVHTGLFPEKEGPNSNEIFGILIAAAIVITILVVAAHCGGMPSVNGSQGRGMSTSGQGSHGNFQPPKVPATAHVWWWRRRRPVRWFGSSVDRDHAMPVITAWFHDCGSYHIYQIIPQMMEFLKWLYQKYYRRSASLSRKTVWFRDWASYHIHRIIIPDDGVPKMTVPEVL